MPGDLSNGPVMPIAGISHVLTKLLDGLGDTWPGTC